MQVLKRKSSVSVAVEAECDSREDAEISEEVKFLLQIFFFFLSLLRRLLLIEAFSSSMREPLFASMQDAPAGDRDVSTLSPSPSWM